MIDLPVITAALPALEQNSLSAADHFAGPALFILGGRSRYVAAADHAAIRAHFPEARIEVIAESGHNPHMETREAFTGLINSFA